MPEQRTMNKQVSDRKPHVLFVPFPVQGHLNPSLAFARCLASKGVEIKVITTNKISKSSKVSLCNSISFHSISDGSEDVKLALLFGIYHGLRAITYNKCGKTWHIFSQETQTIESHLDHFKAVFSSNLANYIDEQIVSGSCPKVIVYDSIMPWILDIAHERGLLGASFFTMCCGVNSVMYHVKQGTLRFPYENSSVSLPCLPTLEKEDLFSYLEQRDPTGVVVRVVADQFVNIEKVDWIFFNTFYELEKEVLDWMATRCSITTIGPTFLLPRTNDNHLDKNHMINLFEPKHEAYIEWLDSMETGSVVYVSFGSLASLGNEQMEEVAQGLLMSHCNFLWVVRDSEFDKLPQGFTSAASGKGLIINWCYQPGVLAHRALACFMTHCGWNSTLEALSNGVPLIAMGQWADQKMNAKFIEDSWAVGVRIRPGENGIIGREEIGMCVTEVTQGSKGVELKRNASKWKELAHEAVEKGGTSANNVEEFVQKLLSTS